MTQTECFQCSDSFEQDAICYVCYQKLQNKIENLTAEIKRLKAKLNSVQGEQHE